MSLLIESDGRTVRLYHYIPSDIAAYIFAALFGIGTLVHLFYIFRLRAKCFIPFVLGCTFETFGYYGRAWSHNEPKLLEAYILQSLLILTTPTLLSATIYMFLGRVINALDADNYSMIRSRWLTTIFVLGDVLCFCMQMGGSGMQATGDESLTMIGGNIALAGLILQVVVFACFVLVAAVFDRRLSHRPNSGNCQWKSQVEETYWSTGFDGFVMKHEPMLYLFDALLMALVVYVFIWVHPGRLIRAVRKAEIIIKEEFGKVTEVQERNGEGQTQGTSGMP